MMRARRRLLEFHAARAENPGTLAETGCLTRRSHVAPLRWVRLPVHGRPGDARMIDNG